MIQILLFYVTSCRNLFQALKSTVHVVISQRSGMGKSLRVRRMAELIGRVNKSSMPSYVCIPIHGPEVFVRHILETMEQCRQDPTDPHPQLIHFNIAQSVSYVIKLCVNSNYIV